MATVQPSSYGERVTWQPATPRLRAGRGGAAMTAEIEFWFQTTP